MELHQELAFNDEADSPLAQMSGSPFRLAAFADGCPPNAGISRGMWDSCQDLVAKALFDPFVIDLAHGTLPRSAFAAFISQDAYFLTTFSQGYEAAIGRCSSGTAGRGGTAAHAHALRELLQGVLEELRMHESYAAAWGVDLRECHVAPVTTAYTEFLLDIIKQPKESVASIVSAMIPCLRLYAYIGCTLAKAFPDAEHDYVDWILTYTAMPYLKMAATAEAILDDLADTESHGKLLGQYRAAMQLETDFFAAQPHTPAPRCVTLLVVDFDDTCTVDDTTAAIAHTAIASSSKRVGGKEGPAAGAALLAVLGERLQGLVKNYLDKRDALLEEILPALPEEEAEEFDMGWLGDFLDRLSDFDREMNSVVVESGILSGIKRGTLADTGARVTIRPGCLEVLRRAVDAGIPTAVVSVNWSAEMVRAALAQKGLPVVIANGAGGTGTGVEGSPPPLGAVCVYANELEYFGDVSTGNIKRRCQSSADKGHIFDDLLLGMAAEGVAVHEGVCVYVGDSMTDLTPLLSADIGILMGGNQLVRHVAAVAGVRMLPLVRCAADGGAAATPTADESPALYEAATWEEVHAFLFNRAFKPPLLRTQPSFREQSSLPKGVKVPRVLSIAGSDSGGGAGIQADTKACVANGAYAATAVTALTVQNSNGVGAVHVAPVDIIRGQIQAVLEDIGADAVKTGMLPAVDIVEAVAEELTQRCAATPLVVDPVLLATSGDALARPGVAAALLQHLFPLATVVTPNIPEASTLLGGRLITDVDAMKSAAQELHGFGPQWVLVKGGHMEATPASSSSSANGLPPTARIVTDVLFDGKNFMEFSSPYIETQNMHGTGCTLAAAIAAELAKGCDVPTAVRAARRYVWRLLERSAGLPIGQGSQRSMNHGFRTHDWKSELALAAAAAAAEPNQGRGAAGEESVAQETTASMEEQEAAALLAWRLPNSVDLRVYAVTDPDLIAQSDRSLADAVRLAIDGGATIVQLREKNREGGRFAELAADALCACRSLGVQLIINDRVDVALAVGADGVHVGQEDLPAAAVRRLIGPDCILGVSVKSVEQAVRAEADGADYLGAGAVYPSPTKAGSSVIGLEGLAAICAAVKIPVVAIGGISAGGVGPVVAAGAAGAAVVAGIFAAPEGPAAAARELRGRVDVAVAARHSGSSDKADGG